MKELTDIRYYDSRREKDLSNIIILIKNSIEITNIELKSFYQCKQNPSNILEYQNHNNKNIQYNNNEYPFFILSHNHTSYSIFINEEYYKEHETEILNQLLKAYIYSDSDTIIIPTIFINEYCFKILAKTNKKIKLPNIEIDPKLLNILYKCNTKILYKKDTVLGYNKELIKKNQVLSISIKDLNDYDFEGLQFLNKSVKIYITKRLDELDAYNYTYELIKFMKQHNMNNQIELSMNNPDNYIKSKLSSIQYENLTFVDSIGITYNQEELLDVNKKLDIIIKNLNLDNLTPFEKYLKIYNFVKTYKKYNESVNKKASRSLKLILDNEYIVCLGYVNLLQALLNKVNIPSTHFPVNYQTNVQSLEINNHVRILVRLNDPQYDIKGIYYGDPTFEQNSPFNFNFALKPLKCLDTEYEINTSLISLLFNVNNLENYTENVHYIIRIYSERYQKDEMFNDKFEFYAYEELYENIRKIMIELDKEFIINLENKYSQKDINTYKLKILEIGKYICINQGSKVKSETIIKTHLKLEKLTKDLYPMYKEYYDNREQEYFKRKK